MRSNLNSIVSEKLTGMKLNMLIVKLISHNYVVAILTIYLLGQLPSKKDYEGFYSILWVQTKGIFVYQTNFNFINSEQCRQVLARHFKISRNVTCKRMSAIFWTHVMRSHLYVLSFIMLILKLCPRSEWSVTRKNRLIHWM